MRSAHIGERYGGRASPPLPPRRWLGQMKLDDPFDRPHPGDLPGEDEPVGVLLASLRDTLVRPPSPEVADRHRQDLLALLGELQAAPSGTRWLVRRRRPLFAGTRWLARVRRASALTAVKVAVTATAAMAATGGLAATGNLPPPAQDAVARVAERVGVEIPAGSPARGSDARGRGTPARPGGPANGRGVGPDGTPPGRADADPPGTDRGRGTRGGAEGRRDVREDRPTGRPDDPRPDDEEGPGRQPAPVPKRGGSARR